MFMFHTINSALLSRQPKLELSKYGIRLTRPADDAAKN